MGDLIGEPAPGAVSAAIQISDSDDPGGIASDACTMPPRIIGAEGVTVNVPAPCVSAMKSFVSPSPAPRPNCAATLDVVFATETVFPCGTGFVAPVRSAPGAAVPEVAAGPGGPCSAKAFTAISEAP